ncbi:hypothetical protein ACT6NV_00675 [Robiginitalea sp. IMCC44478]|uniref:hypothetical protein n=1 Tax=Robiginitalea sp. IMCC44478 TaxID=3459122 RepID=UPI004042E6D7
MLNNKFWQGFFALAPLISVFLLLITYLSFIFEIIRREGDFGHYSSEPPMAILGGLGIFFIVIFLVILISLGSLVFYIVHAAKNPDLQQNNLLLVWILLFVFANGIGQLIYWIVEILGKPDKSVPASGS